MAVKRLLKKAAKLISKKKPLTKRQNKKVGRLMLRADKKKKSDIKEGGTISGRTTRKLIKKVYKRSKPKDKVSKSDRAMLKRMDKDIQTYSKIDALPGKAKKQKRKRVIKKANSKTGNKVKIKLKKGGGIKKTVTRKGSKRRVVKKKRDTRSSTLNAMRNLRDRRRAKKTETKQARRKPTENRRSKTKSTRGGQGRTPYIRG
jgi:hypothetical protein